VGAGCYCTNEETFSMTANCAIPVQINFLFFLFGRVDFDVSWL